MPSPSNFFTTKNLTPCTTIPSSHEV
jgi:hypothetical protein